MNESTKKETGNNAIKVWEALNRAVTGISIQELCSLLRLTFEEVFQAIRWLAKDHNIGLNQEGGQLILIGE